MAELVDALDSKSVPSGVRVRFPLRVHFLFYEITFFKVIFIAISTLFAVHIAYHLVQLAVLWFLDFRQIELRFETISFETSLDPRAWSKKRILVCRRRAAR